jgi:hypothetical protein
MNESNTEIAVIPVNTNGDVDEDYDLARHSLRDIITTGNKALEDLSNIASASQHPRAYEVMAVFVKNLGDVADKLMNLQKDRQDVLSHEAPAVPTQPIHVANAIFVGTTAELLEAADRYKPKP